MADNLSVARMTLIGIIANQMTRTHLDYYSSAENPLITGVEIADAAYNFVWGEIQDLIVAKYELLEIVAWYSDANLQSPTYTLQVNELGLDISSQALPPYCTVNVTKTPDPTTRTPQANDPFKPGYTGWAGVPEDAQSNGLLDATYFTNWSAAAINYREMDIDEDGTPIEYTLGITRETPIIADRTSVMTASVSVKQVIGTRNSRKR